MQSADYAVANLEISLGGEEPYSGYPCFNCPDAILDALIDAGFDMTLTANNHMGDTGFEGFERTQTVLTEKGLDWIGSVKNSSDKRYKVVDINGIKVGMVNYTYISHEDGTTYLNGVPISDEFAARINCFDYNELDTSSPLKPPESKPFASTPWAMKFPINGSSCSKRTSLPRTLRTACCSTPTSPEWVTAPFN